MNPLQHPTSYFSRLIPLHCDLLSLISQHHQWLHSLWGTSYLAGSQLSIKKRRKTRNVPINTCTNERLNFTFSLLEQTQLQSFGLCDWNVMSASQTGNNFQLHQSVFLLSKAPTGGIQSETDSQRTSNTTLNLLPRMTVATLRFQPSWVSKKIKTKVDNLKGFTFTQTPAWAQYGALLWLADWRSTLQGGDTMCEQKFDGNPDLAAAIFSESAVTRKGHCAQLARSYFN